MEKLFPVVRLYPTFSSENNSEDAFDAFCFSCKQALKGPWDASRREKQISVRSGSGCGLQVSLAASVPVLLWRAVLALSLLRS